MRPAIAKNPEKWVAELGLSLALRTKPTEPPGCLILEDLQTLHISTKKKLEESSLDTIQATPFFPWWLSTSLLSRKL